LGKGLKSEFFFPSLIENEKKKLRKLSKEETHPSLARAGFAAVDDVLDRKVGHRERARSPADVVSVGERGRRG
jgi:hypothetical protein